MNNTILSLLKPEEMDYLTTHFRLTTNTSPDRQLSIPAIDLLDEADCLTYLERITSIFRSQYKLVTASQFAKRYSFLTITSSLYAMTMFNKGLDYSLENCHLESEYKDQTWLPHVRLSAWHVTEPTGGSRSEWRDQILTNIFARNIAKVWRLLSKITNISSTILWENTAVYVYWLYEKRIGEGATKQQKKLIHEDFQYLLSEAPASLFGETENPLTRFNRPKCTISTSDQPIRIRQTCCYSYQISSSKKYCSTCPRNKLDNQRT